MFYMIARRLQCMFFHLMRRKTGMLVTKEKAVVLSCVSRRAFYKRISKNKINTTVDEDDIGNRRIRTEAGLRRR